MPVALAAALIATGCVRSDAEPVERYVGLELHVGEFSRVPAAPGQRAWAVADGRSVHLAHALTIPGEQIGRIEPTLDGDVPGLAFMLSDEIAPQVEAVTTRNVGRAMGLVAGGELLSVATVSAPFASSFLTHVDSQAQAEALVRRLTVDAPRAPDAATP